MFAFGVLMLGVVAFTAGIVWIGYRQERRTEDDPSRDSDADTD